MPYLIRISTFNFFSLLFHFFELCRYDWIVLSHTRKLCQNPSARMPLIWENVMLTKYFYNSMFRFAIHLAPRQYDTVTHLIATKVFAIHSHGIPFTWKDLCWIFLSYSLFSCWTCSSCPVLSHARYHLPVPAYILYTHN